MNEPRFVIGGAGMAGILSVITLQEAGLTDITVYEKADRLGVALDDVWAKRPSAYVAISVPEFPNLFMLNGPNGPVGSVRRSSRGQPIRDLRLWSATSATRVVVA